MQQHVTLGYMILAEACHVTLCYVTLAETGNVIFFYAILAATSLGIALHDFSKNTSCDMLVVLEKHVTWPFLVGFWGHVTGHCGTWFWWNMSRDIALPDSWGKMSRDIALRAFNGNMSQDIAIQDIGWSHHMFPPWSRNAVTWRASTKQWHDCRVTCINYRRASLSSCFARPSGCSILFYILLWCIWLFFMC